jgi:hypothetical protein
VTTSGSGAVTTLTAGKDIVQQTGSRVSSDALRLQAGGDATLETATNTVGTLAASTGGKLSYVDADALRVGTVTTTSGPASLLGSTVGVSAAGATTLQTLDGTTGSLTLADNVTTSGSGAVTTLTAGKDIVQEAGSRVSSDALRLQAGGDATLENIATNTVGTLAASTGGKLSYVDADALRVGTVTTTSGPASLLGSTVGVSAAGATTLQTLDGTTGSLTLADSVTTSGSGAVTTLAAGKDIVQQAGSRVASDALRLQAGGDATLETATNTVGTLAAEVATGDLRFVNAQALAIGSVTTSTAAAAGTTDGARTASAGRHISLQSLAGDISINQQLTTTADAGGTDTATLSAAGGITQSSSAGATLSASQLRVLTAAGGASLANTGNVVGAVAADVTGGSFALASNRALAVGSVTTATPLLAGTSTGIMTRGQGISVSTSGAGSDVRLDADVLTTAGGASAGADIKVAAGGALAQAAGNLRGGTDGTVRLGAAAGGVSQTGNGVVTASRLLVEAAADSALLNAGNAVATLAATSGGAFSYRNAGNLEIGSVTRADATPVNGVAAAGKVFVETPSGNLTLTQQVSGVGSGANSNAVVLHAGNRFHNEATPGSTAVVADNGRWLIYDNNPTLQDKELGGLTPDFMRLATFYASYGPDRVTQAGNGYLTTAGFMPPEQIARPVGGVVQAETQYNNRTVSLGYIGGGEVVNGAIFVQVSEPLVPIGTVTPVSLFMAPAGVPVRPLMVPILLSAERGSHFQSSLAGLAGRGEIENVTLANGDPLPDWINFDVASKRIFGTLPADASGQIPLLVIVRDPDGVERRKVDLLMKVSMAD